VHESEAPYESRALRAVIADDDPFARRVLTQVVHEAGVVVVAEAADGSAAIELAARHRPDLVLMDVGMAEVDGIAATRRIVQERPEQLVILVSGRDDEETAVLGLRAGARGFLGKDLPLEAFSRAIMGALDGEAALSRALTRCVIEQLRFTPALGAGFRPVHSPLTTREWEVLDQICDGRTTEEMAKAFVVSEETIRSHVKRILHKLGVNSRQQAVASVRRMGRADV
jgi:two-component system, NarL family, response regulator LiaR